MTTAIGLTYFIAYLLLIIVLVVIFIVMAINVGKIRREAKMQTDLLQKIHSELSGRK